MDTAVNYIVWIIITCFVLCILYNIIKNIKNKKGFKIIKFDNPNYMIINFLYGEIDSKSGKGAFFEEKDGYTLKIESKDNKLFNMTFPKTFIEKFEINIIPDFEETDKIEDYTVNPTKSYFSGRVQGDFETEKGISMGKVYETTLTFKDKKRITFTSEMDPRAYFK